MRNKWIRMLLCMQLSVPVMPSLALDSSQPIQATPTIAASEPGFVDMLKRGGKEVVDDVLWCGKTLYTLGSSLASGIRWCYFDKPQTWEGFGKKKALATAFVIGAAYYTIKHDVMLKAIQKKIATSQKTTPGQDFLFGSWQCGTETYKTAYEITNNKDVAKTLLHAAKTEGSGILVHNAQGLISPAQVTIGDVCGALVAEKQALENDLKTISCFTDAPLKIAYMVKERAKDEFNLSSWHYDKASIRQDVVNYFKTTNVDLDGFGQELCGESLSVKNFLFIPPSWWRFVYPHHWRLGFLYSKATKLYWKVYTTYLRTCALHDAAVAYQNPKKEKEGNVIVNVNNGNNNSSKNKNKNT